MTQPLVMLLPRLQLLWLYCSFASCLLNGIPPLLATLYGFVVPIIEKVPERRKGEKYQTTAFPFPYWSGGLPWERAGVFTGLHA